MPFGDATLHLLMADGEHWCPCCERFGDEPDMVAVPYPSGQIEWWHITCVEEHEDLLPDPPPTPQNPDDGLSQDSGGSPTRESRHAGTVAGYFAEDGAATLEA